MRFFLSSRTAGQWTKPLTTFLEVMAAKEMYKRRIKREKQTITNQTKFR
jgi:hypothetical protein